MRQRQIRELKQERWDELEEDVAMDFFFWVLRSSFPRIVAEWLGPELQGRIHLCDAAGGALHTIEVRDAHSPLARWVEAAGFDAVDARRVEVELCDLELVHVTVDGHTVELRVEPEAYDDDAELIGPPRRSREPSPFDEGGTA